MTTSAGAINLNVSSEEESDGQSALRAVEEEEMRVGGKRGPQGRTRIHWHTPSITVEPGTKSKRWLFKCRYCDATRSVPRTASCKDFDDEKPQPRLGNLSTHTHHAHADKWETLPDNSNIDSTVITQKGSAAVSAKIMDAYLANGTKPMFPTKEGFLRHFVAWVIEDDLPWTTGETPGIIRLFRFAEVRWELPSDTTVRKM
ncbi:hypothetical protein P692DRAFT_20764764, partial [Suillus brevipes Sb2]